MRLFLALTLSCVLVVGGLLASAATALAYTPDNEELTFLALINDYRAQQGLSALAINPELGTAAKARSQDMGATGYFDHTAPDGTTFDQTIRRNGYQGDTVGENIAAGMETAAEALIAWQNSPEHNAGMLNPAFTEVGIGRAFVEGSEFGWYWTTTFGGGVPPGGATQLNADGAGNRGRDSSTVTDTVIAEPSSSITSGEPATTEPTTNVSEYDGEVVETQQEAAPAVNADGANVSATDDGAGPAVGDGVVTTYPDINTGGVQGDNVNYDQSVTPPTTSSPPAEQTAPPVAETAAPVESAAPVDATTTTTTPNNGTVTETYTENIQEGDGNAQSLGNPTNADASSQTGTVTTDGTVSETVAPVVTDAAPADPAAAPAPVAPSGVDPALAGLGCANYTTWYDAQVAYETGGGTAADPAFVNSLDPNADGVACEDLMNY